MSKNIKIIAEVGWNHMGDIELAEKMISQASLSGADYCKFQTWKVDSLKNGPWDADGRLEIYKKAELSNEKHEKLFQICQKNKIKFMTSVFNKKDLKFVSSLSNEIVKIPSHEVYNIDLIQAPMNLVDRRLEKSGCLQYLRQKNIEIHIRSIFLQGLLLMQKEVIPSQFNKWKHLWDHWENWHKVTGYSKLNACISYPLYCDEIDKIIIGIESSSQLEEILKNMDEIPASEMPNLANYSQDLINPSKWTDQKK